MIDPEMNTRPPADAAEAVQRLSEALLSAGVSPTTVERLASLVESEGAEGFELRVEECLDPVPLQPIITGRTLGSILDPDLVVGNLGAASWPPIVSEAIRLLRRKVNCLELEEAKQSLLRGGLRPSWFPGNGLGIPHVQVKTLDSPRLIVFRLRSPLHVAERADDPIRFFFFLFDGMGHPERHAALLQAINHLMDSNANRGLLHATTDSWALYQTLKALEDLL